MRRNLEKEEEGSWQEGVVGGDEKGKNIEGLETGKKKFMGERG